MDLGKVATVSHMATAGGDRRLEAEEGGGGRKRNEREEKPVLMEA